MTMILDENKQNFTIIDNSILDEFEVFDNINEKMVYITLKKFAFGGAEKVFPGVKTIAKMCLISESSVRRSLNSLKDKGLIDIVYRTKENGQNDTNLYIIKNFISAKNTILNSSIDENDDAVTVKGGILSDRQGDTVTVKGRVLSDRQEDTVTVTAKEYEFNNTKLKKKKRRSNDKNTSTTSSNPFHFYENNFGVMSPFLAEEIGYWIDDLSEELVIKALKITLERNRRTWGYTKSILRDWQSNNIKTLKDLEAFELTIKQNVSSKQKRNDSLTALEEFKRKRGIG